MSGAIYQTSAGLSIVYHGYFLDAANNAALRTFSSVPFGNPATDREIVLAIACGSFSGGPAVVVGGITCSDFSGGYTSSWGCHIARTPVPTGASGTITVDPDTTSNGVAIFVFSIARIGSDPSDDRASQYSGLGAQTLDTLEGGAVIGAISSQSATGTGEYTISSFARLFQDKYESGNGFAAVCYVEPTPADETARSFLGAGAGNWGAAIRSLGPV